VDLGVIADAAEESVGDAGCAAAATAEVSEGFFIARDTQEYGGALQAKLEVFFGPEFQVQLDAEAGAEGCGDEAGAGGGADEGEGLEGDVDGFGVHAAIDGEIDAEIFHGGVDEFLDDSREAMDLVDKEDVAALEVGEDAHEVAGSGEGGSGAGFEVGLHFVGDDVGKGGFAESGGAVEEDMLDGFGALAGGGEGDADFFE